MAEEDDGHDGPIDESAGEEERKPLITIRDDAEIGKMYLFEYDPKYKATLPYYDRFPLVFPIEYYYNGFLGLNMHYLPGGARLSLMNMMRNILSDIDNDEETRLRLSYSVLKAFATLFSGYEECIKRYLYTHIRSPYGYVAPEMWESALMAPLERWASRGSAQKPRKNTRRKNGV
jgi:hypothetical protein